MNVILSADIVLNLVQVTIMKLKSMVLYYVNKSRQDIDYFELYEEDNNPILKHGGIGGPEVSKTLNIPTYNRWRDR